MKGLVEMSLTLLEKGAYVHAKDSDGDTPLLWACEYGHNDIVSMLRENGAEA
jgi:ankyrin repeat protein